MAAFVSRSSSDNGSPIVVPFIRLFLELYDVHVVELPGITSSAVFRRAAGQCRNSSRRIVAGQRRGVVFMNHEE